MSLTVAFILLRPYEAAQRLGVTETTLATWRSLQRYPLDFVRIGRKIFYKSTDIEDFISARTVAGRPEPHAPRRRRKK